MRKTIAMESLWNHISICFASEINKLSASRSKSAFCMYEHRHWTVHMVCLNLKLELYCPSKSLLRTRIHWLFGHSLEQGRICWLIQSCFPLDSRKATPDTNLEPFYGCNKVSGWAKLLFTRSKGHGSGCTTALSGMHRYLYCVYWSNTARLLVQWQHTKPAQLNSGTDTKTVPASKTKGKCAGNTPNTLILANRPRSEPN